VAALSALAGYVRRAQALLREGVSVNPVGVYLPLPDVFAGQGAGGLHMDVEFERQLGPEFLFGLRTAGYDFDLVHDHALSTLARVEGGRLRAGTAAFSAVVVPAVRLMPPASLARLAQLAASGGHVIFVERVPDGAPGLPDRAARDAELRATLARLWGPEKPVPGTTRTIAGAGSVSLVADNVAAFARLAAVLPPDFRIVSAGDGRDAAALASARQNVGFLHRRSGAADHYLIANVSGQACSLRPAGSRPPRSPPMGRGQRPAVGPRLRIRFLRRPAGHRGGAAPRGVRVVLRRLRAVDRGPRREPHAVRRVLPALGIGGRRPAGCGSARAGARDEAEAPTRGRRSARRARPGWRLDAPARTRRTDRTEGSRFLGRPARRARLQRLGQIRIRFDLPSLGEDVEWEIDLGTVRETAEVTLNGKPLGVAWKNPGGSSAGPLSAPAEMSSLSRSPTSGSTRC